MKSVRLYLSILFSLLFVGIATAQEGTIKGTLSDSANPEEALPFANVLVKEIRKGAATDFDGNYILQVDEGVYTLEFSFIGYETKTVENVKVVAGQETILNVSLGTSSITMGEVELVEKINRESDVAVMLEAKNSDEVKTIVTTAELAKSGVSNIGDGLTKVTGISTVGSKYVFVRGMGDRYNNATLNGLPLPSPNPDTKIPRLDIFPTSIASNLSVVKAFTPSLYGDFSGGNINIDTKTSNGKNEFKISLGTSMNTQTTFKEFNTYEGSSTDALGFDNGDRDLPSELTSFSSNNVASSFTHGLNPELKSSAPLNGSISLSYLYSKELKNEESEIGFVSALKYGNSYSFRDGQLKQINRQDVEQLNYDTKTYTFNTNTSALLGFTYDKNLNNRYRANLIYVNLSSDNVRELEGSNFDYQAKVAARRFSFRRNNMIIGQLLGDHKFKENDQLKVDWGVSYSIAQSDEPDRKQLVFLKTGTDSYKLNKIDANENHRFFSELDETEMGAKLNAKYVFKYSAPTDTTNAEPLSHLNLGFNYRLKQRDFDYRQFNYRFSSNINDIDYLNPEGVINDAAVSNGDVQLTERGDPASEQKSSLMVAAGYADYVHQLTDRMQITGGARLEKSIQDTKYKEASTGIERTNELDEMYVLPALNLRFDKSEKTVMRFSYSNTVSRPGFREMATFEYTEDFAGDKTRGNPDLVNGENINVDLKWEHYPSRGQMLSISGFGKMLDKPIEKTALASASGRLISFENAKEATVAGLELEYVGNLKTIFGKESLESFDVGFNAAYIYTEVTSAGADGGVSKIFTNDKRPLQGASPYLVNMNLSYNFDNGQEDEEKLRESTITLAYNVYGKRLFAAGTQGIGDSFEQPVGTLNLTYSQDISDRMKLRFTAKNLLDPTIEIIQENENADHVINSYQRGINFGISLNYKLM